MSEALAALYDLAQPCHVCEEHRATREGYAGCSRWLVCDRADCGEVLECVACGEWSPVPRDGSPPCCLGCGCGEVHRAPRSTAWSDLPHASSLRAANAAHKALS